MSTARILVVDDENDIRELVRDILSEEGYAVETAGNAAEARAACALRAARSRAARHLDARHRRHHPAARVAAGADAHGRPVVMMSGHGTVETAVEATRLGAVDFVEKPLSLAKLLRTVERALEDGQATPARDPHAACRR